MSITADGEAPLIGFKRHLRAATVPGEAVYLTSVRGTVALSGEPMQVLAPLLDGSRTLAEVHTVASRELEAGQLGRILGMLAGANLVGARPRHQVGDDEAAQAFWDLAGLVPTSPALASTVPVVALTALGAVDIRPAAIALSGAGVKVVPSMDGVDPGPEVLQMILCDDYLDPRLQAFNAARLGDGRAWVLAKPTGVDLWIGPFVRPGQGACWECLASRLRAHRRSDLRLRERATGKTGAPPDASLSATRGAALALAALEVSKWFAGWGPENADTIWSLDTLSLRSARHRVERRPQCPACGDPEMISARAHQPIVLRSRPSVACEGNGQRARTTAEVWQRYEHLSDPLIGIMTAIQRDPRCPSFTHSYLSGPNLAHDDASLAALKAGLRQQSGGKGSTELEARVGALCEAVERYSGSRFGDEAVVRGTYRELAADAVHPDECQNFDPRQFASRDEWNAHAGLFQVVAEPFDQDAVIDWTPIWSLSRRRHLLMPTDLLYFGSRRNPSLKATSNGNAAGASIEDAIVQGFLELVERDAVAIWWYNRIRHQAIDLHSFNDPWMSALSQHYRTIHRDVWLLDVTSDLGIPVVAAISRRHDKPAEDIMLGFGAHFDPAIAARRALSELGQLLPAVAQVTSDGSGYGAVDGDLLHWWKNATISSEPYLVPDPTHSPKTAGQFAYQAQGDLREQVYDLVALAARHGLEVLVLDQTRPDIAMPVVKVVVPGLRHFWARLGPGRLFDVPVRQGHLRAPTAYEDLNPTCLFL